MGIETRRRRSPRGYEKLVVSTTAVGLASVPDQTTGGPIDLTLIRVTGAGVRYRDDGTNPTASEGFPLNADEIFEYDGPAQQIKFIRSGAADATLYVLYYS